VARATIETWLKNHAWAILASAFAIYGGFVTGQTTTETRLAILEGKVAEADLRLDGRSDFMVCAVRQMDQIQDRLDIHPPCALNVED